MGPGFTAVWFALAAVAAAPPARVRPVFVSAGAPASDELRALFAGACQRAGLPPPELVEVAGAPPPQAAQALAAATTFLDQLRFDEAIRALDLAATDAAVTGAAGLDATALADIYLLRAAATQKSGRAGEPRAWDDFVRAASLAPERVLDGGRFPPAVIKEWKRAVTEVQRRPRGTLVVRAPVEARISIDGRAPARAPAVAPGLPFGQHHLRVEEPGRLPWGTVVSVTAATVELDVPPRPALALDDGAAAARGRRAGAPFVLLAQPRAGASEGLLSLALVEVTGETRRAQELVDTGASGVLDAAVRRLVEAASPPAVSPPPRFVAAEVRREEPRSWLTRPATWIVVGATTLAIVAGAIVLSRPAANPGGFSTAVDPSRIGQ
jgi:hypothetical protein